MKKINLKNIEATSSKKRFKSNSFGKDIAIIGAAGRFGSANNLDEFWEVLKEGRDCIGTLPQTRKDDLYNFFENIGIKRETIQNRFIDGAYLEKVDGFDANFFSIAPREADLLDPNQRIFLEEAWNAIENAGYGNSRLKGSNTGVFIGYSSDFGNSYKDIILTHEPNNVGTAVAGNIKSIIASRISYILDLKGPALSIDTACSSSLVAVHLACQSLQRGECEVAIAGGVKLHLVPVRGDEKIKAGIHEVTGVESKEGITKTFDIDSDGTGIGEGAGVIILKPLAKAMMDKDNILAVVKSSAMNQDGNSIGITAPNSSAQEEVILKAWKNASIKPETISYIEAHGTATKLGDPIEIDGIRRAFRKHTNKKQFCGIGSVKTNIGHLDHAAGIAGLLKLILSLKNKQLPPIVHFNSPNQQIDFDQSPVYINNILKDWSVEEKQARRCAISSFGLSGTNCHLILEEAKKNSLTEINNNEEDFILPLSAMSVKGLQRLINQFCSFFLNNSVLHPLALVKTASIGRGHYNHRLLIQFKSIEDLKSKFSILQKEGIQNTSQTDVHYGFYKITSDKNQSPESFEITEDQKKFFTQKINMSLKKKSIETLTNEEKQTLINFYIKGADIDWNYLYKNCHLNTIEIPSYPFVNKRHWVKKQNNLQIQTTIQEVGVFGHPLLNNCLINTPDLKCYSSKLSVEKNWELSDHIIQDECILPGTAYLELVRKVVEEEFEITTYNFKDIVFISPLKVMPKKQAHVTTLIEKQNEYYKFTIYSSVGKTNSVVHCEGKVYFNPPEDTISIDIEDLKSTAETVIKFDTKDFANRGIETGERWDCFDALYNHKESFLVALRLPKTYVSDLKTYFLHPALLDCAANAANFLAGTGLYLPLSYKDLRIYKSLPQEIYSYIRLKSPKNKEVVKFDISVFDKDGNLLVDVKDYTIKRVNNKLSKTNAIYSKEHWFYTTSWQPHQLEQTSSIKTSGAYLVFMDDDSLKDDDVCELIRTQGGRVIEVHLGEAFKQVKTDVFTISTEEEAIEQLLESLEGTELNGIVQFYTHQTKIDTLEQLDFYKKQRIDFWFYLIKAFLKRKVKLKEGITVFAVQADGVNGSESNLLPINNSLLALLKVLRNEYPNFKIKGVDIEEVLPSKVVLDEILGQDKAFVVAYRNGQRFIETFQKKEPSKIDKYKIELEKEGVYLITGGTGGLGLEVADYLSSLENIKIVLLSRRGLPPKNVWKSIIQECENSKLASKIIRIMNMERKGSQVYSYGVDVSCETKMEETLSYIRKEHGKVQGIIHAAGIAGDGFIFNKPKENFDKVINPKIYGTWILDHLTRIDQPDFMVLFSSITTLMATPGQGDYCAANAFLDAYAKYRNQLGFKTLTINWPAWAETGMAVDYKVDLTAGPFRAVSTSHALNLLWDAINMNIDRVFLASLNYDNIDTTDDLPFVFSNDIQKILTKSIKDIGLTGSKDNTNLVVIGNKELNQVEMEVAKIWQKIIGIEEIDIYESFYKLGGNSILATSLLKEYEKIYPGVVEVADIFTYTSIHEIANYIKSKINEEQNDLKHNGLDDILERLSKGELDLNEANKLISL